MANRKNKKLRYGFIGAGGIAGTHLRDLSRREDVELVAMADISETSMRGYQDRFDIPQVIDGGWRPSREEAQDGKQRDQV